MKQNLLQHYEEIEQAIIYASELQEQNLQKRASLLKRERTIVARILLYLNKRLLRKIAEQHSDLHCLKFDLDTVYPYLTAFTENQEK